MECQFKAPRGTQDILPDKVEILQRVESKLLNCARRFGFFEIRTPTFEKTDLFERTVGDSTDVVQKEMFTFCDRGGRSLSLRPEGTAAVVRAVLETGLVNEPLPLKLCYLNSCFRNERPQAGRLKEFHQFGAELFGSNFPIADAEMISLADCLFAELDVFDLTLNINSIGCLKCRKKYIKNLVEYYQKHSKNLCETCLNRLEKNPMRLIDCKNENCKEISKNAPKILNYLCKECGEHFDAVKKMLDAQEISYVVNPYIVRGLDYYTRTVFEFTSDQLGAQNTICGGGRYDNLVELIGGKPMPALGLGIGIERLMMIMEAQKNPMLISQKECDIYIGSIGKRAVKVANLLASDFRKFGLSAQTDLVGRSTRSQMKYANKIGANYSCIIGDLEINEGRVTIKNMRTKKQFDILLADFLDEFMDEVCEGGK